MSVDVAGMCVLQRQASRRVFDRAVSSKEVSKLSTGNRFRFFLFYKLCSGRKRRATNK